MAARAWTGAARGRHRHRRRARHDGVLAEGGYYVRPAIVEMPAQTDIVRARDLRADPLRDALPRRSTRPSRCTTTCRRACRRASSRPTCARRSASCRRPAPIAASPTSTSARRAPRSAARSAARRKPAAAARSGSDAWKGYMRRQTSTVNYSARAAAGAGHQVRHLTENVGHGLHEGLRSSVSARSGARRRAAARVRLRRHRLRPAPRRGARRPVRGRRAPTTKNVDGCRPSARTSKPCCPACRIS